MYKNIKLIGTDLDGTLLNDDKKLSAVTKDAIKRARAAGMHIVPITGRPLLGVPECVRELGEIEYIITTNGASIYDVKKKETIYCGAIDNAKSRALIESLRRLDCMFEPFADGGAYTEQNVFDYYIATFKGTPLEDYFFSSRIICDGYEALFENGERTAEEFFVNCAEAEIRDKVIGIVNAIGGLQYCNLGDRFIEITRAGVDKGSALRAICNHLGVNLENTIAFGDGENDLQFIQAAGVSVAMQNAFPIIKEHADFVTKSNNENGVAVIINSMLKEND